MLVPVMTFETTSSLLTRLLSLIIIDEAKPPIDYSQFNIPLKIIINSHFIFETNE